MTIAQAFNLAFEGWLSANERKIKRKGNLNNRAKERGLKRTENKVDKVIDFKKNISDAIAKCENIVDGLDSKENLSVAQPRLSQNSFITDRSVVKAHIAKTGGESLLIDFSSWNVEKLEKTNTDVAEIEQDADKLELLNMGQDGDMDLRFTQYVFLYISITSHFISAHRIAQRNTPIPILRNLQKNNSTLQIGSFLWASLADGLVPSLFQKQGNRLLLWMAGYLPFPQS